MNVAIRRGVFWIIAAGLLVLVFTYAFKPRPQWVDLASVGVGPLTVTVSEDGETRVRDIYELSSPLMGRVLRIDVEAGDSVVAAETIVARIEPSDPSFLDVRSEEEARAAVKAAEAELALARAQLNEAESELEFAVSELERAKKLVARKIVSERELDRATKEHKTKQASIDTAIASIRARESELAKAKARLVTPVEIRDSNMECNCLSIFAPITGSILRVLHESEGVVEAGASLVEIGNTSDLEIVVDFLSVDAVQIEAGQRVIIEDWGGATPLKGVVKKVEPFGYTKVSSLGIEEQRVNVVIDFMDPNEVWKSLGHGYQVETHVVLWEENNVLKLPITALFREGGGWATFVVEDDRARLREVEVGKRNDYEAQIINGVLKDEKVILHPGNLIEDGTLVAERPI